MEGTGSFYELEKRKSAYYGLFDGLHVISELGGIHDTYMEKILPAAEYPSEEKGGPLIFYDAHWGSV